MDGMPTYAECGGLVYLTESITAGKEYQMAGVLPARAFQNDRFQALGYIDATCTGGTALLPQGINYRGHEFHYSSVECYEDSRFCLRLSRGKGIQDGMDGRDLVGQEVLLERCDERDASTNTGLIEDVHPFLFGQ